MGLAASQGRFLQLTARKSDLEFSGQNINQRRMALTYRAEAINTQLYEKQMALYNSAEIGDSPFVDITTPEIEALLSQINIFHDMDRQLEIELKNIDTQQQAVQTEIDAVNKVIDKNIDMTFKTFA